MNGVRIPQISFAGSITEQSTANSGKYFPPKRSHATWLSEQFDPLRELPQFLLSCFYGNPLSMCSTTLLAHQHVYQLVLTRSSVGMVGIGPALGTHEDNCSRAVLDSSQAIDHV